MKGYNAAVDACDSLDWEVVFVPGWGLEKGFWTFVQAALIDMSGLNLRCMTIELGSTISLPPSKTFRLVVGHSTGFLWLLQQRPFLWDCLIAVNGFTRFIADKNFPQGVEEDLLQRMLSHFQQNPNIVVAAFLRRCGIRRPKSVPPHTVPILRQGLFCLRDWDARQAFTTEKAPLLILAGGADLIVPPAMTKACFHHRSDVPIFWQPAGGHLLPLSHPEWLAIRIWRFASLLCAHAHTTRKTVHNI